MKKRNKVSAEFSMSSLTDIIFLLLIFFMLTSTLVKLDNVELPESDSQTVAPTSIAVTIPKKGKMMVNNKPMSSLSRVKSAVRSLYNEQEDKKNATITIVAETGTPWDKVEDVMGIAANLRMRAILATQPKKN
ncbi:MAG: biopolymer transporter ExbD [Saprospiraceae bacterium]|jgi:biopolymer transport protein ExbD|nr:biopolymer transporter ExbD [Saprospiraceae bacterium]